MSSYHRILTLDDDQLQALDRAMDIGIDHDIHVVWNEERDVVKIFPIFQTDSNGDEVTRYEVPGFLWQGGIDGVCREITHQRLFADTKRQASEAVFGVDTVAARTVSFFDDLKKNIYEPGPNYVFLHQSQYDEYKAALEASPRFQKEPAMFTTTVTITRDDILAGTEWIEKLVHASIPGEPSTPRERSTYYKDPNYEEAAFTVTAITPDETEAIVAYPAGHTDRVKVVDILDRVLAGAVFE